MIIVGRFHLIKRWLVEMTFEKSKIATTLVESELRWNKNLYRA